MIAGHRRTGHEPAPVTLAQAGTFRHSFATHLLEAGYLSAVPYTAQAGDIRIVQELLGHIDKSLSQNENHR